MSEWEGDNSTLLHYRRNTLDLIHRYESVEVFHLQMLLEQAMHGCSDVLELGCGSGRDAAFLLRQNPGLSITASDGCMEMLLAAGRLHSELIPYLKQLVLPGDLEKLAAAGKRFSGVYAIATLMHLPPPDICRTLENTALLLNQGGVFFLSVCTRRTRPSSDHRHYTLRSPGWWAKRYEAKGFRTIESVVTESSSPNGNTLWFTATCTRN